MMMMAPALICWTPTRHYYQVMKLRPTDTHGLSSFGKKKQQIFSYFLYQATGTVKEPLYSPTLSLSISCSCLCCFVSFFSRCLFRMDATARSSCRVNRTNHAESRCVRAGNRERRTDASATCVFCRQTSARTGRTRVHHPLAKTRKEK